MATVAEMLDGRTGGVRGQHGSENLSRTFHVTTDAYTDDPSAVLQVTSGGVTLGSSHPWGAFGVVVIGFSERERLTQTQWVVDAIYGPPLVIDPNRPWDISIDVSLTTYTEYKDLDGQVIGPAVYYPKPDPLQYSTADYTAELQRLAARNFDTSVARYRAPTSEDGYQPLFIAKNEKRRATGLERTRKVATFSLSRTLPRLQASQIASVQGMVNTVNSSFFFGAAPGCAKFIGMRTRSGQGTMVGQLIPNVVFDCELIFAIDWDGHNPNNEYDIYEHADGTQAVVETENGGAVVREYRLYEDLEFNTILAWLDR